jgi:hypothetical protein
METGFNSAEQRKLWGTHFALTSPVGGPVPGIAPTLFGLASDVEIYSSRILCRSYDFANRVSCCFGSLLLRLN